MPTASCARRCSATSRRDGRRSSTRSPARCCGRRLGTGSRALRSRDSPQSPRDGPASRRPSRHDPAAMRPAKLLFWASSALIVHTHAGYPALLWLLARDRRAPDPKTHGTPPVTVVVAAYDEEEVIARKVENVLAVDYPRDRLELIV